MVGLLGIKIGLLDVGFGLLEIVFGSGILKEKLEIGLGHFVFEND